LYLATFVSNNLLPPEACVLHNFIMSIHKLGTLNQKEYHTCRS